MRNIFGASIAALFLLPLTVFAMPTGLNMMPTAESLGTAQLRIDETNGSGKTFVPVDSDGAVFGAQIGVILGVEGGADYISDGSKSVLNAKWVFKSDGLILPALAVGADNIGPDEKMEVYAVATKSIIPTTDLLKVHGGVMRDMNDDMYAMYGVSSKIGPISLKADRLDGGAHKGTAFGAGWSFRNLTVSAAHYAYDRTSDENALSLSYTFKPLSR